MIIFGSGIVGAFGGLFILLFIVISCMVCFGVPIGVFRKERENKDRIYENRKRGINAINEAISVFHVGEYVYRDLSSDGLRYYQIEEIILGEYTSKHGNFSSELEVNTVPKMMVRLIATKKYGLIRPEKQINELEDLVKMYEHPIDRKIDSDIFLQWWGDELHIAKRLRKMCADDIAIIQDKLRTEWLL